MTRFIFIALFVPLSILSAFAQTNLQRSVFFDKDKSEIKPQSETSLLEVMDFLNKNPSFQILLKGFTDADGSDEHNRTLSERRVYAVRQFLEQKGINTAKITTLALGKAQPIANNATEEGKQQNRRVDINVTFVQKGKIENLSNLYRELATPIQIFKINTAKDTTIRGEKGTIIAIPKNAFTGVPNGAIVDFKLKEAYSFSDIIRDNLNTMSGDKILQTGGMIYTEANFKGQQLGLQEDLQVQFNSKESKLEGMQLFSGERNMQNNGEMNWTPLSNSDAKNEVTTIYASPNVAFRPYLILNEKTNKPITIKELCDTTGCYPLFINENKIDGFSVRPNMSNVCGAMAMFVEARPNLPRNMPLAEIHKATFFEIYDKYNVKLFDELKKQDGRIWDSIMFMRNRLINVYANQIEELTRKQQFDGIFSTRIMGWQNCDGFYIGEKRVINIISNTKSLNFNNVRYKVISKNSKVIIANGSTLADKTIITYSQSNEPIVVVAFTIENGEVYLATAEKMAKPNMDISLNFKQMSVAEIKEKLKVLDN